jgi:aldehyde:ferredoxin oxidoreductase
LLGNFGKLLIVDLTNMDIVEKELERDLFYHYLGGRGLGAYLLTKMLLPGVEPLSPRNVIVFTSGPAVDSGLFAAAGYGIFTKSPLTGLFAEAYCRGYLPAMLKKTGYDALVISGSASKPCFITLSEQGVSFFSATEIWGFDTDRAECSILNTVGDADSEALVIGPAGERMVAFANLKSSRYRNFSRAGFGAVFGSKKLKGIVFKGSARAAFFEGQTESVIRWNNNLKERYYRGDLAKRESNQHLPGLLAMANTRGCFTGGYWSEGRLEGWNKLVDSFRSEALQVSDKSCSNCIFACEKMIILQAGDRKELRFDNLDYFSISALGGLCRLTDLKKISELLDYCNRAGLDPVSAGNVASFAAAAGEKGLLEKGPRFGDYYSIAAFLLAVVEGKAEGTIFGGGIQEAADALGLEDYAIHFGGLEPAGFDPRVIKVAGFAGLVSEFGEQRPVPFYLPGIARGLFNTEKRKNLPGLFVEYEDKETVLDSLIMCRKCHMLVEWEDLIRAIYILTGERYSAAELRSVSARIITTIRLFNLNQAGAESGSKLPLRLTEEPINEDKNIIKIREMELMLKDYFMLRGWNEKGTPPVGISNEKYLRRSLKCL